MAAKFVLALALFAVAAVHTDARRAHANEYVNAYFSRQMVMQACFGREFVRADNLKISNARRTCRNELPRTKLDEPKSHAHFKYDKIQEQTREKPYFSERMVRYLSERFIAKASNDTCILRELKYMDENDNLNFDELLTEIAGLTSVDDEIKGVLTAGANACKSLTQCLPMTEIAYPLTPALMRWSVFSKCWVGHVYQACIRKDLKEHAEEFDLSGLGNYLADRTDSGKMYGVIWARTVLDQGSDYLW